MQMHRRRRWDGAQKYHTLNLGLLCMINPCRYSPSLGVSPFLSLYPVILTEFHFLFFMFVLIGGHNEKQFFSFSPSHQLCCFHFNHRAIILQSRLLPHLANLYKVMTVAAFDWRLSCQTASPGSHITIKPIRWCVILQSSL